MSPLPVSGLQPSDVIQPSVQPHQEIAPPPSTTSSLRETMTQALPQEQRNTVLYGVEKVSDQYVAAELLAAVTFPETAAQAATIHRKLAQVLPYLTDETLISETTNLLQQIPPKMIRDCLHDQDSLIIHDFLHGHSAYSIAENVDRVTVLSGERSELKYIQQDSYPGLIASLYSSFRTEMIRAQRVAEVELHENARSRPHAPQLTKLQYLTRMFNQKLYPRSTEKCLGSVINAMHCLAILEQALILTEEEKDKLFPREEVVTPTV